MHTQQSSLSARNLIEYAGWQRLKLSRRRHDYYTYRLEERELIFRITIIGKTVHFRCYDILTNDELEHIRGQVVEIEKASEFLEGYGNAVDCYLTMVKCIYRERLDREETEVPELLKPLLSRFNPCTWTP